MKKLIAIVSVLMAMAVVSAQVFPARFAGVAFGKPSSETIATLDKEGVTYKLDGGLLAYTYSVADENWYIIAEELNGVVCRVFAQKKVDKVFTTYLETRDMLKDRYGKPSRDMMTFDSPFEMGDGYEDTAIATGNAHIVARWNADNWSVGVMASRDHSVVIIYTSDEKAVQAEAARKEAAKKAQF